MTNLDIEKSFKNHFNNKLENEECKFGDHTFIRIAATYVQQTNYPTKFIALEAFKRTSEGGMGLKKGDIEYLFSYFNLNKKNSDSWVRAKHHSLIPNADFFTLIKKAKTDKSFSTFISSLEDVLAK